jgi:hypothetical protein
VSLRSRNQVQTQPWFYVPGVRVEPSFSLFGGWEGGGVGQVLPCSACRSSEQQGGVFNLYLSFPPHFRDSVTEVLVIDLPKVT